ncbi:MAG: formate dehydrogenase accessory sulfurtransferase FdhD [Flavobacteriales bacterium]|nr:formate dehydrogenase accessory sulfurtransferase FdhD [Flavobacteriales bacterium]
MKTNAYNALRHQVNGDNTVSDILTVEHPLSISINGTPFTLTMQTPGNEKELARGLLFTEGVYKKKSGELKIEVEEKSEQDFISRVNINIPENELDASQLNKRNLLSVASCGICGKTELDVIERKEFTSNTQLSFVDVPKMFNEMSKHQDAFLSSGGCHASAAFDGERKMLTLMEDIGRHNAVDKVIGALLNNGQLKEAKFLLVSGRVSYEIVTKCFIAGIPFLLAVSAPSSLAVDFSKELGVTLLGFCREDRATCYSHPERIE